MRKTTINGKRSSFKAKTTGDSLAKDKQQVDQSIQINTLHPIRCY